MSEAVSVSDTGFERAGIKGLEYEDNSIYGCRTVGSAAVRLRNVQRQG